MATTPSTITEVPGGGHVVSWPTMANDDGKPLEGAAAADRSVQFEGTFGGATFVLEGSNDGTNYHTLKDPFGNGIEVTAAGFVGVMEVARYVRPRGSGGTGTDVDVFLFIKR
jgi:hypothetical protein